MGSNLPAKKYKKSNPTQLRLSFEGIGNATRFIDIGMALSAVNRRFYRQGVYYYVNSVEVYNNSTGVIDVHTLPDNWVTKAAHQRGFRLFQKMNSMVDSPISTIGRPSYHDFKVFMSDLHRTSGSLRPSLHQINNANVLVNVDDWVYSEFVSADDDGDSTQDADEFKVHMLGPHQGDVDNWESVGLIKSFADSRITVEPDSPESAPIDRTDPLINVFDFSSEEQMNDIIQNLTDFNDEPPYDQSFYVGESSSHMQHVARIGTEEGVGRIGRAAGFCAPFGLVCLDPWGLPAGDNFRVVLNLASGTYKGVYAERV